ncbi:unnamed protein product [Kuraishia capsulata CBS 1993]|uniref:Uncharacterized protein n=1 Tax=Kuraishia capsulata CBS 1993 TaxID=1382522 RepID=W6MG77_9ASCO|nr:uncharacterized protein KUCA_T00000727001 [Kuraishia capsulata CBS 1993]CDK24761.1 unnamed protein product [Kuraishia capsulata CBS 1993]
MSDQSLSTTTSPTCAKCHKIRTSPQTDRNPDSLAKYKTCDECRDRNKLYKKNQKLRMLEKLNSIGSETGYQTRQSSILDPVDYELSKETLFEKDFSNTARVIDTRADFNGFLEGLSRNAFEDVASLKFKGKVPQYVLQTLGDRNPLLGLFLHPNSNYEDMEAVGAMKEIFKNGLRIHYIARIQDVLEKAGYRFTGRSTKWKGTRYYSQMTCTRDSANLKPDHKENTASRSYDCNSRLNLSYDAYAGTLGLEYSHRRHSADARPAIKVPGMAEELTETPLLGSFASKLNALHSGEWGT